MVNDFGRQRRGLAEQGLFTALLAPSVCPWQSLLQTCPAGWAGYWHQERESEGGAAPWGRPARFQTLLLENGQHGECSVFSFKLMYVILYFLDSHQQSQDA